MKKICVILFMGLFIPVSLAYGSFAVFYDKDTKEVKFIGNEKNIILSDTDKAQFSKIVKKGDIKDYALSEIIYDYKIINNNFVINTQKISDRENAKIIENEKYAELKIIEDKAKDTAIKELKKEGKSFKYHE